MLLTSLNLAQGKTGAGALEWRVWECSYIQKPVAEQQPCIHYMHKSSGDFFFLYLRKMHSMGKDRGNALSMLKR